MITYEEALAVVLDGCAPLPSRPLTLAAAGGCVLADEVLATELMPPFANTAMDGYALRADDVSEVPVELPVVAEVAAGHPADRSLAAGEAMRIFTGAPLPTGADAVVMVERTARVGDDRVRIDQAVAEGDHVRPAGDDVRPGDRLARPGDELTPARLALFRSLGVEQVSAFPKPWVGVVSTGDELVEGPGELAPGQIRDSNRPMLLSLVEAAGFKPVDLGHVDDDEEAITRVVETAGSHCDALVTTGGVSMGDTDLVKVVLDRMAAGDGMMRWMQVAIKPAKPLAFGVVRPRGRALPVFGLPGNPVSAFVSFELFARPALRRIAGHREEKWFRPRLPGTAGVDIDRREDGKTHFLRATVEVAGGEIRVVPVALQGSHQLAGLALADALAVLPDGPGAAAGEPVELLLLS